MGRYLPPRVTSPLHNRYAHIHACSLCHAANVAGCFTPWKATDGQVSLAVSCHVMSYHGVSCCDMSWYVMSCCMHCVAMCHTLPTWRHSPAPTAAPEHGSKVRPCNMLLNVTNYKLPCALLNSTAFLTRGVACCNKLKAFCFVCFTVPHTACIKCTMLCFDLRSQHQMYWCSVFSNSVTTQPVRPQE